MANLARLVIVCLVLPVVVASTARRAHADAPSESTVTAAADALVRVQAVSGAVHIAGWDRSEVRVKTASGPVSVTTTDGGARVSIATSRSETLDVWVPTSAHVEVRALNAGIGVQSVAGPVQVRTVNGSVDIGGPSRAVDVNTVSGRVELTLARADVRVTSVNGAVHVRCLGGGSSWIKTVSGTATVAGSSMSRVEMHTVSGDLSLESRLQDDGPFAMRSHTGSIHVVLPRDSSVAVEAHTFSGHVEDASPDGGVGTGRRVLTVSSFSGNISIERQ